MSTHDASAARIAGRRPPAGQPDRRRTRWRLQVVDGFHLTFVLTNVLGLAFLLLVLAGAAFVPTIVALRSPDQRVAAEAAGRFLLMHSWLWPSLFLLLAAATAKLIYTTHKVAGPLVRFRNVFREIRDGNYSAVVRLRAGDYLDLEAQALNEALDGLRRRDQKARELSSQVVDAVRGLVDRQDGRLAGAAEALSTAEALHAVLTGATAPDAAAASPEDHGRPGGLWLARGFTLVELLLVVALMAVLFAIAIPSYSAALEEARNARAIGDIKAIEKELWVFRLTRGVFPAALADIDRGDTRDPWGHPYQYLPLEGMVKNGNAGAMGSSEPDGPVGTSGGGPQGGGATGGGAGGGTGGGGTSGGTGGGGTGGATGGGSAGGGAGGGNDGSGGGAAAQARKDRNLHPLNSDFDLYSMGPDGKSLPPLTAKVSWDDVIRASDGGYVGRASRY